MEPSTDTASERFVVVAERDGTTERTTTRTTTRSERAAALLAGNLAYEGDTVTVIDGNDDPIPAWRFVTDHQTRRAVATVTAQRQVADELTALGRRLAAVGERVKEWERAEFQHDESDLPYELAAAIDSALDHIDHLVGAVDGLEPTDVDEESAPTSPGGATGTIRAARDEFPADALRVRPVATDA